MMIASVPGRAGLDRLALRLRFATGETVDSARPYLVRSEREERLPTEN